MVEVTFSESGEDTYLESAKKAALRFRRQNENASKAGGIIRDKIGTFTLFKVLMFSLLIWIIRCSGEDASYEVKSDREIPKWLGGYRLLAESEVQFDAVFDLYKKNFLTKMGYTDEDSERIKTTVKSHLDKTKGMDMDQQRRKKLGDCERIIKQGSDNSISAFSNNFRELSYPYFLVLCAFILYSNEYYRFFAALMVILILKFVNFSWDLKYIFSRMAESM